MEPLLTNSMTNQFMNALTEHYIAAQISTLTDHVARSK